MPDLLNTNASLEGKTVTVNQNADTFTGVKTFTAKPVINAGLQFPAAQAASADANTLDDYEEGTFTPTIISSGGGTPTYALQNAAYTKIGQLVEFQISIHLTDLGSLAAGNITVGGLPFTSNANFVAPVSVPHWILTTAAIGLPSFINVGSTVVTLYISTAATASTFGALLTKADLAATSRLYIHGCYRADA